MTITDAIAVYLIIGTLLCGPIALAWALWRDK